MRLITVPGCEAIPLVNGFNRLVIENIDLYWQLQQLLQGDETIEGYYSMDNKPQKIKNTVVMLGDLVNPHDYGKIFAPKIGQVLQHYCSDESQNELFRLNEQIKDIVIEQIDESNLPFEISDEWAIGELFKYCKLVLLPPTTHSDNGIMRYIIETASQLGDDRLFVVCDIGRYLSESDQLDLITTINELKLNFLELRQTGVRPAYLDTEAFHVIDEDYVMF